MVFDGLQLLNVLVNPIGDPPSASVDTVVFATTKNGTEAGNSIDVPSSVFWVLTEKTTAAVTSTSILKKEVGELFKSIRRRKAQGGFESQPP